MIKTSQDAYLAGRQAAMEKLSNSNFGEEYADALAEREPFSYLKNIGGGAAIGGLTGLLGTGATYALTRDAALAKNMAKLLGGGLAAYGAAAGGARSYLGNRAIDIAGTPGVDRDVMVANLNKLHHDDSWMLSRDRLDKELEHQRSMKR
tara:strand:- start:1006 stop:1452 length:447 start_codon:yes stop_codon:yes gene_type:complete